MAYYAYLDDASNVVEVISGRDEGELGVDWEDYYGQIRGRRCLRTSYNTHGGVHILGGTPYRKNYAGIGYTYDETRDAFISPKPFDSWLLNEDSCLWEPPVAYPTDGKQYTWDENTLSWLDSE